MEDKQEYLHMRHRMQSATYHFLSFLNYTEMLAESAGISAERIREEIDAEIQREQNSGNFVMAHKIDADKILELARIKK